MSDYDSEDAKEIIDAALEVERLEIAWEKGFTYDDAKFVAAHKRLRKALGLDN